MTAYVIEKTVGDKKTYVNFDYNLFWSTSVLSAYFYPTKESAEEDIPRLMKRENNIEDTKPELMAKGIIKNDPNYVKPKISMCVREVEVNIK